MLITAKCVNKKYYTYCVLETKVLIKTQLTPLDNNRRKYFIKWPFFINLGIIYIRVIEPTLLSSTWNYIEFNSFTESTEQTLGIIHLSLS